MTADPLRKSIETLRGLAPRLHAATDDAARVVQTVEKFLAEECRLTLCAWVPLYAEDPTHDSPPAKSLGYARLAGRSRIAIREDLPAAAIGDGEPRIYAWSDAPRGDRLQSFQHLPALLDHICDLAQSCIKSTHDTAATVSRMLDAAAPAISRAAAPAPPAPAISRPAPRRGAARAAPPPPPPPLCREYPEDGVQRPLRVI